MHLHSFKLILIISITALFLSTEANGFATPDTNSIAWSDIRQFGVLKNIYYIPGEHLFGDDGEGSTDGSHPNDLGFTRQAEIFATVLAPLLKTENEK